MLRPVLTEDLIRLGNEGDGGYVLNKRIVDNTQILLSFGIDTDWTFEADFEKKSPVKNMRIEAYDFSVDFPYFLKTALKYLNRSFTSQSIFLNLKYSVFFLLKGFKFKHFFLKKGIKFYKKGIDNVNSELFLDFNSVFKNFNANLKPDMIFIKMDIEGYEYKVLQPMLEFAIHINGFIVEFHDLDKHGLEFENLIEQIKGKGFVITHVHPNNWGGFIENTQLPKFLEITFSKSSFFSHQQLSAINDLQYPLEGLDYPCVPTLPELAMRY